MVLEVKKKERENSQNLVHRFTKVVRQSGVLLEVRDKQFKKRAKSALAKKRSALRRVELRAQKKIQDKLSEIKKQLLVIEEKVDEIERQNEGSYYPDTGPPSFSSDA